MANPQPDWQGELARQRNRIAADRTLMAWIRAGLILITVGFGLVRGVQITQPTLADRLLPLGLLCVAMGSGWVAIAARDHWQESQRLTQPTYRYQPRPSLARWFGVTVWLGGLLAAISLVWGGILHPG